MLTLITDLLLIVILVEAISLLGMLQFYLVLVILEKVFRPPDQPRDSRGRFLSIER